ncbi:MAG: hypothetical protein ABIM50_04085 [Novosphingobium sp.]
MPDFELHGTRKPAPSNWEGFAQIDRAIAENRVTAYRWKKAWADPVSRTIGIVVGAAIVAVWTYLAGAGLGWW